MTDPKPVDEIVEEEQLIERWEERSLAAIQRQEQELLEFEALSDEERQARYDRAIEEHREHLLRKALDEMPARFHRSIPLRPEVEAWFQDFRSGFPSDRERFSLVLIGRPGCGKSHTCFELIKKIAAFGWDEYNYQHAPSLLRNLTPRSGISDIDLINTLQKVDLLFLDDLGANKLTEWREEKILEVIDERWLRERPTVVTTNIPPDRFSDHFGARTASRLAGMCRVVKFPYVDYRNPDTKDAS